MKKEITTALLYASEIPIGVYAGFQLGVANYYFAVILTALMMVIEVAAVLTWMQAQTEEIINAEKKGVRRRRHGL